MNSECADDTTVCRQVIAETVEQVETAAWQKDRQGQPARGRAPADFPERIAGKNPFAAHVQHRPETGIAGGTPFKQVRQYLANITGNAPDLAFYRLCDIQSDVHDYFICNSNWTAGVIERQISRALWQNVRVETRERQL
jgi:hypothetical protein